jgi:hypothetical protein
MNTRAYPSTSHPQDFAAHDHFYQRVWAEDLQYHFPFLASDAVEHPRAIASNLVAVLHAT